MAIHAHSTLPPAAQARARLRRHVDRHLSRLETLIRLLDLEDGDPDFEPELGWPEPMSHLTADQHLSLCYQVAHLGPQLAAGDREEDPDLEPSLGATADASQLCWGGTGDQAASADLEYEHDGREPQCEDEGAQCDDDGAQWDDAPGARARLMARRETVRALEHEPSL